MNSKLVIVIAKQSDENGVYYSFNNPFNIKEPDSINLSVTWSDKGIEIMDTTALKIVVPKSKFIGGR